MTFEIITSFNKTYYDNIGKDCVSTWLKNWPSELSLTCYVEEFSLPAQSRIKQIQFDELGESYRQFQQSDEGDRVKIFAKKAYSVIHAFENSVADRIMWIDADVITTEKVSLEFLENLCSDDTLAAFMGVWHHKDKSNKLGNMYFSVETGIFVVNRNHKEFSNFSKRYQQYYDQRIKENIRRFYDGEVFGAVIKEFESKAKMNDFCKKFEKKYKSPLKHTTLGKYFIHYKSKHSKEDYLANQ